MLTVWLIIVLLVFINSFYVAAEFGAVSVRRSKVRELAESGHRLALRLLPVLDDPARLDRYIAACQIGITWSSLVLGASCRNWLVKNKPSGKVGQAALAAVAFVASRGT